MAVSSGVAADGAALLSPATGLGEPAAPLAEVGRPSRGPLCHVMMGPDAVRTIGRLAAFLGFASSSSHSTVLRAWLKSR